MVGLSSLFFKLDQNEERIASGKRTLMCRNVNSAKQGLTIILRVHMFYRNNITAYCRVIE
jgi:hypothetical protein